MPRFLHAADIHLDSPMRGLERYEDAPVEAFRNAPRQAFANVIDLALTEEVSAVVIAGDLFDGDWKSVETGLYFAQQIGRLREADIPCIVLSGNHDAASRMTRRLPFPNNVHHFGHKQAESVPYEDAGLVFHGQSFARPDVTDNLASAYPKALPGFINIGVLHTALEGNAKHASYAPCTRDQLASHGYDYWALGHVHEREVVRNNPYIVYPGNIQGRSVRECGPRGVALVEYDADAIRSVDFVDTHVAVWQCHSVDLSGAKSMHEASARIATELEAFLREASTDQPMALRVLLEGATSLNARIDHEETQVRNIVRAHLAGLSSDEIWLERVVNRTQPAHDLEAIQARKDALAELTGYLQEAAASDAIRTAMRDEVNSALAKADAQIKQAMDEEMQSEDVIERLLEKAVTRVAQLAEEEGQ